jgi:hypothetical protein
MKPSDQAWQRLAAAARRAPADHRETAAPPGFSTRIAALAMTAETPLASVFERFSLRALGVAALLAVVSVAADYSVFSGNAGEDEMPSDDGAVAAVLDLSS